MTVKIVTDSVSDIPRDIAEELGIKVIPLTVCFGEEVYRDGIDLTPDRFFEKLATEKQLPVTSAPPPAIFAEVYDRVAEETDQILVITLTSKLSGTYNFALQGISLMQRDCYVEVIDSRMAIMGQGFVVIEAAKAAMSDNDINGIKDVIYRTIPRVNFRAAFDDLSYLAGGGRIGKAQAFLGSIFNFNPILGMKDGEVYPVARVQSRSKALDNLIRFVLSYRKIQGLAVEYATAYDEAQMLIERFNAVFPKDDIILSRTSPVISTHTGPSLIIVTVQGEA